MIKRVGTPHWTFKNCNAIQVTKVSKLHMVTLYFERGIKLHITANDYDTVNPPKNIEWLFYLCLSLFMSVFNSHNVP